MINNKTLPAEGNLYTCDGAKKKAPFMLILCAMLPTPT